jgi:hypothetical protein
LEKRANYKGCLGIYMTHAFLMEDWACLLRKPAMKLCYYGFRSIVTNSRLSSTQLNLLLWNYKLICQDQLLPIKDGETKTNQILKNIQ